MKLLQLFCGYLIILLGLIGGLKFVQGDSRLALSRFKHAMSKGKVKHSAVQLPHVQYACTTDKDCYPPNLHNTTIPPEYINCDNSSGLCQCNRCFIRENDTCVLARCHNWSNAQCVDQRRSQKTAFLLSVFLSSTGAANFYIGQYDLGAGQLSLLILSIVCVCVVFCLPCCLICCLEDDFEEVSGTLYFVCCLFLLVVMIVLCLFAIVMWWVVDLVVFVQNGRGDGAGCPLLADL